MINRITVDLWVLIIYVNTGFTGVSRVVEATRCFTGDVLYIPMCWSRMREGMVQYKWVVEGVYLFLCTIASIDEVDLHFCRYFLPHFNYVRTEINIFWLWLWLWLYGSSEIRNSTTYFLYVKLTISVQNEDIMIVLCTKHISSMLHSRPSLSWCSVHSMLLLCTLSRVYRV